MPRIEISGVGIDYELLGEPIGRAVAITPGGRLSKDSPGVREMGLAIADRGLRALIWDRPNCGASDLCFDGDSESKLHARVLTKLIRNLDLGPTVVVGGSAGARVSLFAALYDPDVVSHLALWWISGGLISMMRLGSYYCCEPAVEASLKGMEAVAAMPIWAEQLKRNPRNREIMLSQDPQEFTARMERWAAGYIPSETSPVGGITKEDFRRLAMPVMIFRGSPTDLFHPASICEEVHALIPRSELVDAPWPDDIFAHRMRSGPGLFVDWPLLAPAIANFSAR